MITHNYMMAREGHSFPAQWLYHCRLDEENSTLTITYMRHDVILSGPVQALMEALTGDASVAIAERKQLAPPRGAILVDSIQVELRKDDAHS